jgi:hypothetical protein
MNTTKLKSREELELVLQQLDAAFFCNNRLKAISILQQLLNAAKANNKRDGNWCDKWGACRVCDGEIPHGHSNNCDIYKMEQQLSAAVGERDSWREHAALSDKEFLQLEDWLIGNAEIDPKTGLIDRATKCKERIRDLVASEAELSESKAEVERLRQKLFRYENPPDTRSTTDLF